jgi:hypothetical protein
VRLTLAFDKVAIRAETAEEVKVIQAIHRLSENGGKLIIEPFDDKGRVTWTTGEGTKQE